MMIRWPLVVLAALLLALALGASPRSAAADGGGIQAGGGGAGADGESTDGTRQDRTDGRWAGGFTTTVYYPTPEHWFGGPWRQFRGISGWHRAAWLLSAHGVAMQGTGWSRRPTGPDSRRVNYASGTVGWLNARGRPTSPGGPYGWSNGAPAWLACGWQNRRGDWTFPRNYIQKGEPTVWARGRPARWVGCEGVSFRSGPGRRVRFWNSVAVDPSLFPLYRTWFYIPAYRGTRCEGWFRADDTGGAIRGRHLDVYRPPPRSPVSTGTRTDQRVLIVRNRRPAANPCR